MNVRENVQKGRRSRRPNGDPRENQPWSVKGVEETVKSRISILATVLGTSNAAVIDLATKQLSEQLIQQDNAGCRKGNTFSNTFSEYADLLIKDDQPSGDPAVKRLEKRLQERREARDEMMGRKFADASPGASEKGRGK